MDSMKVWNVVCTDGEAPEDGRRVMWLSQLNPMFHSLMPRTVFEFAAVARGGMPENGDGCGLRAWRYADGQTDAGVEPIPEGGA